MSYELVPLVAVLQILNPEMFPSPDEDKMRLLQPSKGDKGVTNLLKSYLHLKRRLLQPSKLRLSALCVSVVGLGMSPFLGGVRDSVMTKCDHVARPFKTNLTHVPYLTDIRNQGEFLEPFPSRCRNR